MVGNKIEKILIVTNESFPNGMAATNRLISHAKGFIYNNINVCVIVINKTEIPNQINNPLSKGVFEGVPYQYLYKTTVKSIWKVKRAFDYYLKNIKLFLCILKNCNYQTAILYYCPETLPAISINIASGITKSLFIKEETEFPEVRMSMKSNMKRNIFLKFHYKLFDGILLITEQLVDYFKKEMYFSKPIIHIPMIVDIDRFLTNSQGTENSLQNIVFTGVIDDQKEGINLLLNAFAKAVCHYHDLKLNIYGVHKTKEALIRHMEQINKLGIENQVTFHGYKNREKITKILQNADILIFPRPNSQQAEYGFSTKLGEYLATGKPVITTDVGEICHYLKDKENAFVCKPTENALMGKIIEVKNNPQLAMSVGSQGEKTVQKYFNNKIQSKNIIKFLLTLDH